MLGEAQPLAADQQGLVPLRCNLAAPAALYRIELDEVRSGRSTALDLVDMHDIEPIAGVRIIFGAAAAHPSPPSVPAARYGPCR